MSTICGDEKMQELAQAMQADEDQMERVEALLDEFPEDARLHFLRGSMLIGKGRLIEAHRALSRAVALAPDFDIARFQLGFFQLTSGEAENALETWGRLDRLPDGHYLRKFVEGLRCLIRDEFANTIETLQQGIALNQENPPLNRDMQLIVDQCRPLLAGARTVDESGESASETSLILQQFTNRHNLH
jgi:tetratricopeptide (TPR) repeat protein